MNKQTTNFYAFANYVGSIKVLFVLMAFGLLLSCSKDTGCGNANDIVNNYNISADDKSKIPFKGNDTLVYISDVGDTAVLVGTGKIVFIDQVRKDISGNADCPKYSVDNNETISIEYTGDNNELNKLKYKIYGNMEKTEIEFTFNNFYGITYPYNFNTPVFYTDSVSIGNQFYIGRPLGLNSPNYKALYNYNYGFLKIQISGSKTWLLKI